jgi:hypothetical protein
MIINIQIKNSIIKGLIPALFILLFSCKSEDFIRRDVLIPVEKGNWWKYQHRYEKDDSVLISTAVIKIQEKVLIDGQSYFSYRKRVFNAMQIFSTDESGNFVIDGAISDSTLILNPTIEFKMDALTNDEWNCTMYDLNWDNGDFSEYTVVMKCVCSDSLIITPKGKYNCIGFEESIYKYDHRLITRYFICKGIGIVRREYFNSDMVVSSFDELIDFNIE